MLLAMLLCIVLLAIGSGLRARVGILRRLYIPGSAIAGLLGFALIQSGLHVPRLDPSAAGLSEELSHWPSWLIAVVFAGLLLERPSGKSFSESLRRGLASGIMAWILILGQIVVGLVVYVILVTPRHPEVPASFGQLLEVSWAGGHGSSAAMGDVYRMQGFTHGRDIAFFLATCGLVYGVVSGLVLVNLAIRRGWVQSRLAKGEAADAASDQPLGTARCAKQIIDPLTLQVVLLGLAFVAGYAMQQACVAVTPQRYSQLVESLPLFMFTLLGGLVLRIVLQKLRLSDLLDEVTVQRIAGVAVDFLVVAAIASMRMDAMREFFLPIVALLVLAAIWCGFCLLYIARRILPQRYWFELGLLNYGFATANTPQGLMLLRIVDPELKSGAAEDYAVAAPLSAPFVGGGVLTIIAFPWLLERVNPLIVASAMTAVIAVLFAAGKRLRSQ